MVRIHTTVGQDGTSKYFDVEEDYDTVLNKLFPLQAENSALEARGNAQFTKADGGRLYILRREVVIMEEINGED